MQITIILENIFIVIIAFLRGFTWHIFAKFKPREKYKNYHKIVQSYSSGVSNESKFYVESKNAINFEIWSIKSTAILKTRDFKRF